MKHGIEQEIQVVNQEGRLLYKVKDVLEKIPDEYKRYKKKGGVYQDLYDSQLEISTCPSEDLEDLKQQLYELRSVVSEKAEKCNLFLIATGANYALNPKVGELFAEQHHLDAYTTEEKIQLNNFLRIFSPELFAISVNSPISQYRITQWKSFRASREYFDISKSINPNIKPTPYLSAEDIERGYLLEFEYEKTFEKKRKKSRYYDITPFTKTDRYTNTWKPTVEVRLFDTQPSILLTIAYAALLRALALKSVEFNHCPNIEVTYNRKMAIEEGIQAKFIIDGNMKRYESLPYYQFPNSIVAYKSVKNLLHWVNSEIKSLGYEKFIRPLTHMLHQQRDLADWQIRLYRENGRKNYVDKLVEKTMENFDSQITEPQTEIVIISPKEKEVNINPYIKKYIDKLVEDIEKIYLMDTRTLISILITLGEILPEKKDQMEKYIDYLKETVDNSGTIKNDLYLTAYFVEMMEIYGKTTDEVFQRSAQCLLKKGMEAIWSPQLWLNAYILIVLKKIGVEKKDVERQLTWIKNRIEIEEDNEIWALAYAFNALNLFGLPTEKLQAKIISKLQKNHWTCKGTDDITVTAIVYRLLLDAGYTNTNVVEWIKTQMLYLDGRDFKSLHKISLLLRAIVEEVVK